MERRPQPAAPLGGEQRYVLPPASGYPLALEPGLERRLEEAYLALVSRGDPAPAEALSAELLRRDPKLHPALVLAAQVDFFRRDPAAALSRLRPIAAELPGYLAAQLLLGRVAERLGDLPLAVESYLQVAERSGAAAERARVLRPRAAEILANRIDDALARGRAGEAGEALRRLEAWAGGDTATLEAAAAVAEATGDGAARLAATRELARRSPGDVALQALWAELEVDSGDAGLGLRMLQGLAAENPGDAGLQESLARAKFRWRLDLLPPEARNLSRLAELTRGDFAGLLFWLFPDVRYGQGGGARIANDIFDHPRRDEIVRVINLGLMDVDPGLHVFEPARPVRRLEVLGALLRLLVRNTPPAACLGSDPPLAPVSVDGICRLGARCGLLAEAAECLPGAPVAGSAAVEMSRRALELLGSG